MRALCYCVWVSVRACTARAVSLRWPIPGPHWHGSSGLPVEASSVAARIRYGVQYYYDSRLSLRCDGSTLLNPPSLRA